MVIHIMLILIFNSGIRKMVKEPIMELLLKYPYQMHFFSRSIDFNPFIQNCIILGYLFLYLLWNGEPKKEDCLTDKIHEILFCVLLLTLIGMGLNEILLLYKSHSQSFIYSSLLLLYLLSMLGRKSPG